MHLSSYILPCVAVFFESLLLWRLLVKRLGWSYPYLSAFVIFTMIRDVGLFPVFWWKPGWFAVVYWRTETISLFLRFALIWEFFRGLFPQRLMLHHIAWKMLQVIGLGVMPIVLILSWRQASEMHLGYAYLSPSFEQYLSLVQVLLLLAPTTIARYYRLHLDRNMRGLGLGLGVYLSICSINFAGWQLFRGFRPYWRLISPVTFIGMIVVWLWAFWEPSLFVVSVSETGVDLEERCEHASFPQKAEDMKRGSS